LLEFMQQMGREAAEEIPLGIHSTRTDGPKDLDGVFLAFRARDRHFWHFYPRINGHIAMDVANLTSEKRKIFKWLQCKASDYPNPDTLPPAEFDNAIFAVLNGATNNLLQDFKRQQSSARLRPTLSKVLQKIQTALTQTDLFNSDYIEVEAPERVLEVITTVALRSYEIDIKKIWDQFVANQDIESLVAGLDELFVDQELYHEIEDDKEPNSLEIIREEEVQLVCYQWFKPK